MQRLLQIRFFAIGIVLSFALGAVISCQPPASSPAFTNDTGAPQAEGSRHDDRRREEGREGESSPSNSSQSNSSPSNSSPSNSSPSNKGAIRDLTRDEAEGGHILRKHVGQTDDELRERLERERRITGASTYTDRSAAEHAVGAAIAQSQERIERWLSRSGGHPNLVLDYDSPTPVGRTLNRGESQPHPCAHALVVLRYSGPNHYYVLTSYPECR